MAEPVAFRCRAFIFYSHANTSWAKWLHRGLETFRIDKDLVGRETATGAIPKTLRPIFRDRDDFTAGSKISDPREGRAYLATLCSDHTMDLRYDSSSLSHGRRDALGRARPHIADGEDTGTTGLKR